MRLDNTIDNTPEHCHDCWRLDECNQAQNMNADTKPVLGFVGDAEIVCVNCVDEYDLVNKMDCGEITGSNETDSPDHCAVCGAPIFCTLTTDGVEYLKDSMDDLSCYQELWPVLFKGYLS